MEEHHIQVPRTARYYILGEAGSGVREVWFVLHGYRQLAGRFMNRFRVVESDTRLLVAPEALSRFYVEEKPGRHGPGSRVGATWMTREHRHAEIRDYVTYLDLLKAKVLADVDSDASVTVLGFSQGVATASRWAVLGEAPPDRLLLWGEYLPPDLDMEKAARRLAETDVTFVVGERDVSRREDLERDQEERLRAWGIRYSVISHSEGHEIEPVTLKELAGGGG